jgi:hypothetical protein
MKGRRTVAKIFEAVKPFFSGGYGSVARTAIQV